MRSSEEKQKWWLTSDFYHVQTAPVCTTELGLVAALQEDFDARNVKVIGLSANELESHEKWIADINEVNNVDLKFPIIADPKREISALYDMLDYQVRRILSIWQVC